MKVSIRFLTTLVSICFLLTTDLSVMAAELTIAREKQLTHMVKQDCGSCHGMTLKGGLGPTLLPQAMNKLPLKAIKNTILLGRPGTAMPPWQSFLTEQEALWISQQLQQGFESDD